MKKLEIIIDYVILNKLLQKLDELKVEGYSVIKDVMGKGSQGNRDGHGLMAGFKNCYIMIIVKEHELEGIINGVNPLIKSFGGMCVVTNVEKFVSRD
jgi:nitrogen regulatory protein PII